MPIKIPDTSWYEGKSVERNAPLSCPYANVHKCYRYYASQDMLGKVGMISSISDEDREDLDTFWANSQLLPVIAEEDTGVSGEKGKPSSFSNFCPEVTFKYFHYYASYLARYVDEIDRDSGQRRADKEKLANDWRYEWGALSACHFLDCDVYSQTHIFNSKKVGGFDSFAHANVIALIGRMEQCLEAEDPSGVLHAASNILETMAKDLIKEKSIQNQTLGKFIEKYEANSQLPGTVKGVVNEIYKLRNTMPISGHGSTKEPHIKIDDAIVIAAMTKFIVEVEYRLHANIKPSTQA